jgi:hypothetical protein
MSVEYLVLQADAEAGPFARIRAEKLNRSWETLQAALDELGQHEWDLDTTIYSWVPLASRDVVPGPCGPLRC